MLDVLSVFYEFQSTLNGGGKGEVFLIYDNITTFCQVIGSVADVLFRIVASGNLTLCPCVDIYTRGWLSSCRDQLRLYYKSTHRQRYT